MLTTASQFGPRARRLRTNHATATAYRVLGASGTAAVQQCQQTRDFRFGSWFWHHDSEVQEQVRRRQQAFKHKYADQLNRRLAWDKHPLADDARNTVKRMMASYWLSHDVRPCGRDIDNAEAKKQRTGDNADGVRPGQSIEDVERGAMEHLIFGKNGDEGNNWAKKKRKRDAKKNRQTYVPHTSYGSLERDDFVIDPITNRKVAKEYDLNFPKDYTETPVKTFSAYRKRFTLGFPVPYDAPSAEEIRKISQDGIGTSRKDTDVALDSPGKPSSVVDSDSQVQNKTFVNGGPGYSQAADSDPWINKQSAPVMHNEHAELQESKPKYDDLHKYKPVMGDAEGPFAGRQNSYNDLDKYKPVMNKKAVRFEDLKPPHEDLDKYTSATVDEIVARFESDMAPVFETAAIHGEDAESKFNDLDKYRTVSLGDAAAKQSEDSPPYEDLDTYKPSKHNEPHGKPLGHQVQSVKPETQGKYQSAVEDLEPGDFPTSTVEQLRVKYGSAELRKYTTVRHIEADGIHGLTAKEPRLNYSDLDNYGPVRWNEPDGIPLSSADERVAEKLTKDYDPEELAKYEPVYYNEPDGNPPPTADERVAEDLTKRYDPDELAKYIPIYWNEPDGQPVAAADSRVAEGLTKNYDPAELAEYKPVYWNEPDGQPLSSVDERAAEGLTKNYDPAELEDYAGHVKWNEPDGQSPTPAEELSKKYPDLDQYGPITYREPDGHPTGQGDSVHGLEEMDARRDYDSAERIAPEELDRADESSAEVLRKMGKGQDVEESKTSGPERRQLLELLLGKYQTASSYTDREAILAVRDARARAAKATQEAEATEEAKATEQAKADEAKVPHNEISERQFTGNYVRDFPEEFEKSWTETLSTAPLGTGQTNDEFVFESQNMDGGLEGAFGRPSPAKIRPALDRHPIETNREQGKEGSDLRTAESLETPHATDYGSTPAPPVYVKHYGNDSASAETGSEAASPESFRHDGMGEPTLYKILAYDPTMQKIEIAETSSFVPDTASALTPADALLRLSHPTRFFPHFAPLKAEGYEIISGTGDVLVFRKVRPEVSRSAGQNPLHDQPTTTTEESGPVETRINPIDMTGRPRFSPASANFASPTGYVNYDNIPETAASKLPPPPPKIKYNIDVHREEPVFSGPKARSSDSQKGKQRGLGKRLVVGGVWVAGISYALGVVAEFFTTGGVDGIGPTGL
ncbi:hypothetical protein Daus18300_009626 [Diaporthe australafricana]|uniref:Uncharacterized protein n=1 Tax=Diaporthe australafricana TaxID=127596 RepID=A0ABR3WDL3_9PEZI